MRNLPRHNNNATDLSRGLVQRFQDLVFDHAPLGLLLGLSLPAVSLSAAEKVEAAPTNAAPPVATNVVSQSSSRAVTKGVLHRDERVYISPKLDISGNERELTLEILKPAGPTFLWVAALQDEKVVGGQAIFAGETNFVPWFMTNGSTGEVTQPLTFICVQVDSEKPKTAQAYFIRAHPEDLGAGVSFNWYPVGSSYSSNEANLLSTVVRGSVSAALSEVRHFESPEVLAREHRRISDAVEDAARKFRDLTEEFSVAQKANPGATGSVLNLPVEALSTSFAQTRTFLQQSNRSAIVQANDKVGQISATLNNRSSDLAQFKIAPEKIRALRELVSVLPQYKVSKSAQNLNVERIIELEISAAERLRSRGEPFEQKINAATESTRELISTYRSKTLWSWVRRIGGGLLLGIGGSFGIRWYRKSKENAEDFLERTDRSLNQNDQDISKTCANALQVVDEVARIQDQFGARTKDSARFQAERQDLGNICRELGCHQRYFAEIRSVRNPKGIVGKFLLTHLSSRAKALYQRSKLQSELSWDGKAPLTLNGKSIQQLGNDVIIPESDFHVRGTNDTRLITLGKCLTKSKAELALDQAIAVGHSSITSETLAAIKKVEELPDSPGSVDRLQLCESARAAVEEKSRLIVDMAPHFEKTVARSEWMNHIYRIGFSANILRQSKIALEPLVQTTHQALLNCGHRGTWLNNHLSNVEQHAAELLGAAIQLTHGKEDLDYFKGRYRAFEREKENFLGIIRRCAGLMEGAAEVQGHRGRVVADIHNIADVTARIANCSRETVFNDLPLHPQATVAQGDFFAQRCLIHLSRGELEDAESMLESAEYCNRKGPEHAQVLLAEVKELVAHYQRQTATVLQLRKEFEVGNSAQFKMLMMQHWRLTFTVKARQSSWEYSNHHRSQTRWVEQNFVR